MSTWNGTPLDPALDSDQDQTLNQARDGIRILATTNAGGHCPCCGQFVKIYKRPLTSSTAAALIQIYRFFQDNPQENWIHIPKFLATVTVPAALRASWHGGDWSKAKFWGLLKPFEGERADGSSRIGIYSITQLGVEFVEGKAQVQKHAFFYAGQFLGLEGGKISIQDILGDRFSYAKLMESL